MTARWASNCCFWFPIQSSHWSISVHNSATCSRVATTMNRTSSYSSWSPSASPGPSFVTALRMGLDSWKPGQTAYFISYPVFSRSLSCFQSFCQAPSSKVTWPQNSSAHRFFKLITLTWLRSCYRFKRQTFSIRSLLRLFQPSPRSSRVIRRLDNQPCLRYFQAFTAFSES